MKMIPIDGCYFPEWYVRKYITLTEEEFQGLLEYLESKHSKESSQDEPDTKN